MKNKSPKLQLPNPLKLSVAGILLNINPERWERGKARIPAIRYRVSHWIANKRISTVFHNPTTLMADAKNWRKTLNSEGYPSSIDLFRQQRRRSMLYGECEDALISHQIDPLRACGLMAGLLEVTGIEGAEKLVAIYAPLFRRCRALFVKDGVDEYRQAIFKVGRPETKDQERKAKCLQLFVDRFGGTQFLYVSVEQIKRFLESSTEGVDMRNKYVYCLRALFAWARDDKEALPARVETVCDLIVGTKPEKSTPEIYSVRDFAWLASVAVDREMVLALLLVGQHFVRQNEAERMHGECFLRDSIGNPIEIIVPAAIAKTGVERAIPIEPIFRPLFKLLVPPAGALFRTKKPFSRIERLARALGVVPKKNGLRHSCVSYAIGAGMRRAKAAELAGHDLQTQRGFYYVLVDPREAKKYRRITFNLGRITGLLPYRRVSFANLGARWNRTHLLGRQPAQSSLPTQPS